MYMILLRTAWARPAISMSPQVQTMMDLRSIMFQDVYLNPVAKKEESKAIKMLTELYQYYIEHPEAMSGEYRELISRKQESVAQAVCDYLAGMTDQYSMEKFREIYIPKAWEVY